MKKLEIKKFADFFGNGISLSKIKDKELRHEMIRLYISLSNINKETDKEINELKETLIGEKVEEVKKYYELKRKYTDDGYSDEEKEEIKKEYEGMTEVISIINDFDEMSEKIYNEEVDVSTIKKVSLESMYDCISECGINVVGIRNDDVTVMMVEKLFGDLIK